MKPLSSFSNQVIIRVLFLIGCAVSAQAQHNGYYTQAAEPARGYWNLKTDHTIRGTLIRFYNGDSQLVYQESMPNRYIKLTSANTRRLDQTLARLVDNQLVASAVAVSGIPVTCSEPVTRRSRPKPATAEPEVTNTPDATGGRVQWYTQAAKPSVHLVLVNPTQERLTITVLGEDHTAVYEHITHLTASRHHINLAGMPAGTYQIRVKSATRQYQQPVTLSYGSRDALVQLMGTDWPTAPQQLITRK
ncbi:hypothetical protein GCM10023189_24060 [Nibrella saemangeumensis]|uniref:Uncharacterized protein n=1 Tax=Nibrella saemangeumensis TaxID=1084526 RepID=A0ABP8MXG9_9BACT